MDPDIASTSGPTLPPAPPPPPPLPPPGPPTAATGPADWEQKTSGRLVDAYATPDQRTYVTFIHLMLVLATVTAVPLVLGPLVMWLIKRDESPFIDDHGREALNFNLSILLYMIVAGFSFVCGIGIVIMPVVWVFGLIFSVKAAIAANRGEYYRYPACIRVIA